MKRLVIYCPGYDLRPLRHSFSLISAEFEKFLKIRQLDGRLELVDEGHDPGGSTGVWQGHVNGPRGTVDTRFVQLGWRDVIKSDFQRSWLRTLADAVRSFYLYARAGGYRAVFKSNWAHGLFCLYPAVGTILYLALTLFPPVLLAPVVLDNADAFIQQKTTVPRDYVRLISWGIHLSVTGLWMAAVFAVLRWMEPRIYFRYLVNSWHFIARLARNEHEQMRARIDEFAELIVALEAQAEEDEELVFVAHSCGTFVAIYVLAAVLRLKPDIGQRPGGFAFVTLGPAFDCLGGYGAEHGFGQAMALVSQSGVDWTDVYGPHDLVCGGRTPPVARYASIDPAGRKMPEPRRFSACIPDRMSADMYRHLRFRFFPLHFCYFLTSVRPGLFDFYELTLGPRPAARQLEAWSKRRKDLPERFEFEAGHTAGGWPNNSGLPAKSPT